MSLEKDESIQLTRVLGNQMSPLTKTVAKLFLCPQGETTWTDVDIWGALCVVIDRRPPKAFCIKMFCLQTWALLFSEEIYIDMVFNKVSDVFYSYEVAGYTVGLLFTDPTHASTFASKVNSNIPTPIEHKPVKQRKKSLFGRVGNMFGLKSSAPAGDIGMPTNVVHVKHVGYDADQGFDTKQLPAEWKSIFRDAGVKKKDLHDPTKAKEIYDVLKSEFGDDIDFSVAPPTPARPPAPARPSPAPPGRPTPAPPGRPAAPARPTPAPPGRPTPAPPGRPAPAMGGPPPPAGGPPKPPSGGPPPPSGGPPKPRGPPAPGPPSSGPTPLKSTPKPKPGGGRGNLLDSIAQGKTLRKVNRDNNPPPSTGSGDKTGDLMSTVKDKLKDRFNALNQSDDDEDDGWSDDDF